jgi:biopolymer transport protein ExbB
MNAHVGTLSAGIWRALICTAGGLAVSIPCYAGYNYLVSRVNTIVLDMEQVSSEILNIVSSPPGETVAARPA